MRKPDDSRSIAFCILSVALSALDLAFRAPTFVLIEVIFFPLKSMIHTINEQKAKTLEKIIF